MEEWSVYMVLCADDTFYTGVAKDISKRLHAHNHTKAGARYTRVRRPVVLAYVETASDRGSAQKREAQLRKLSRHEKMLLSSVPPPVRK